MRCKNCETTLLENQQYCFECGAKVIKNRITFKNIANEINDQFFNLDNKVLKTFRDLFTKPEYVIVNYIEGTRKRHVNVIQYFALSLTLVGIQVFLMNTFFKEAVHESMGFMEGINDMPNSDKNPFAPMDFDQINNYQSVIYVFSVPISALSTWLAYYIVGDRRYNFTEHIVINLYYSAQIIIISSLLYIVFLFMGVDYLWISTIVSILTFVYLFFILHKIFKTAIAESIGRFILIMVFYAALFVVIFLIMLVFGVIYALNSM